MNVIESALQAVLHRIDTAKNTPTCTNKPLLIAVSKGQSADKLKRAFAAGQRAFGENYVQEALQKQQELADLAIEWHFIGPIQSNKTALITQHFAWVHSVDRLKIAQRLNDARGNLPPLNVCIQVNISLEVTKSGTELSEVFELADAISQLPNLKLRGLMAIPEPTTNTGKLQRQFAQMRELKNQLNSQGLMLDTLSMGMSHDFELAIAEGATMVRVGSAIFGERPAKNPISS